MNVLCIIPARGGSKGIPRKNIINLAGKPLIAWSIEAALAATSISRVIVTTDDEEIASVAKIWGAETMLRPPELANDTHINDKLFVAGDVRANENPLLTSLHTLFVREHNRLCVIIKAENPSWNDEKIYQKARKIVGAYFQSIIYNEWLPIQGITLPEYSGYNPEINPGVSNLFSAAAFRLGHTLLSNVLTRIDDNDNELKQGTIELKDAYFNPLLIKISGGIEPFLKGMATQLQQKLDTKIVDGVRSYLFGEPDLGGLDLASINIMRSRERGIPDYNTIREDFGINRVSDFNEITKDSELAKNLKFLYGDVNNIDA